MCWLLLNLVGNGTLLKVLPLSCLLCWVLGSQSATCTQECLLLNSWSSGRIQCHILNFHQVGASSHDMGRPALYIPFLREQEWGNILLLHCWFLAVWVACFTRKWMQIPWAKRLDAWRAERSWIAAYGNSYPHHSLVVLWLGLSGSPKGDRSFFTQFLWGQHTYCRIPVPFWILMLFLSSCPHPLFTSYRPTSLWPAKVQIRS